MRQKINFYFHNRHLGTKSDTTCCSKPRLLRVLGSRLCNFPSSLTSHSYIWHRKLQTNLVSFVKFTYSTSQSGATPGAPRLLSHRPLFFKGNVIISLSQLSKSIFKRQFWVVWERVGCRQRQSAEVPRQNKEVKTLALTLRVTPSVLNSLFSL